MRLGKPDADAQSEEHQTRSDGTEETTSQDKVEKTGPQGDKSDTDENEASTAKKVDASLASQPADDNAPEKKPQDTMTKDPDAAGESVGD